VLRRLAVVFLALSAWSPAAAAAQTGAGITGPVDAANRLELRYEDRGLGRLTGTQSIEFTNVGSTPLATVWLRLWANGPDGCKPRRITVHVGAPAKGGRLRTGCTALPVRLGEPLAPGARTAVTLRWTVRGRPNRDRFGHFGSTVLLGNVVPLLAVTDRRGVHSSEPYVGGAESFYSLAARWDATLDLPRSLRAATTGSVVSEQAKGRRRTVRVSTPQARDFGVAVGHFGIRSRTVAGVRIRVHAGESSRDTRSIMRAAARSVRLLQRRLGSYGSPELDLVGIRANFGMEYPELAFVTGDPGLVAHEVAHQWWYSIVGNDQYREPWLDEAFASYSERDVYGGFRGCSRRRPYNFLPSTFRAARLDRGLRYYARRTPAYYGVVYDGGACALRSLEQDLGRARMTRLLRLLVSRHRHGVITRSDVLRAIREVAPSGFNLRRFRARSRL
jgi:hypothetical protein